MGPPNSDLDVAGRLRRSGHRVTPQRLVIHRLLCEQARHMTAEQVLRAVESRLPGTSLPTVYATLELFERLGVVRRIEAGAGGALFDPRTDPHHHAVCRECGAVQDLDAPLELRPLLSAAQRAGFTPSRVDALMSGHCADCRAA
jgi:Fe2+ or Zn2+ uptake regulation protein